MKKRTLQIWLFCLSPFMAVTIPALSQVAGPLESVAFSEALGPVIDSEENHRFHLFSRDIGLIAAKAYRHRQEGWVLHLVGETQNGAWMLTRKLSPSQRERIQDRIQEGLSKDDGGSYPQFAKPVIEIKLARRNSEHPVNLKLSDNTKLNGKIVSCTADTVQFVTLSGVALSIPDSKILEVGWPRGEFVAGEFRRYDPNYIRLFFGPTGRTLRQGEVNFSDFYVLFPTLAFGITDDFQLGGGISLVPGVDSQLLYISPKLRVLHQEKMDVAVGLLYLGVPGEEAVGTVYSAVTAGSPLTSVSFGVGIPFDRQDIAIDAAIMFGAELQMSNSTKFITENWFFLDDQSESLLLLSAGLRMIGENLTVGFGFATSPDALDEGSGFPFLPWLDFSISLVK